MHAASGAVGSRLITLWTVLPRDFNYEHSGTPVPPSDEVEKYSADAANSACPSDAVMGPLAIVATAVISKGLCSLLPISSLIAGKHELVKCVNALRCL